MPQAITPPSYLEGPLDEIDDFLAVGRTILLNGAGHHPARAALAAGCWLARRGPTSHGSRAARERTRLGWLKTARAALADRRAVRRWNLDPAGRDFVCAWPPGKAAEPLRTPRELLEEGSGEESEVEDVYPWATVEHWLGVLPTVRVYPEGRQGRRVDAPVLEDGKRVSDRAGIDLTVADLHAGAWTGERTLRLFDGSAVVFVSPHKSKG